ncbi:hypothetical protein C4K09_2300 [Pseudomonas chlororaphis subsp. aureofaciens]|nr:hypothetical protein C4K09_2300 [Pseudomonas chlororaphis subsp. aureofaciens]
MSVTDTEVIDMWGIPKWDHNKIVLGITDHLGWADKTEQGEHLLALQEKLNAYIAFIESGDIYTEIPGALGKSPSSASSGSMSFQSKVNSLLIALPRC